ncbi:MAG: hypothetical protein A3G34_17305 [Candidatus Lindowbacteria bacterium RIFCSPLOWO2_12_FULL_62_27]|nr:MAG: hypothetical protein A3G34_17305 [Candidatus Lindowbacteria bacterium RIFCSPLOWO2_12_FULL_62_27]OGH62191.1 MAG: hypothetical protein A3I06_01435 [Candidatus Lindowbacteria bacterium RIFCSPLOWO2_02_FULL_62_12]
MDSTDEMMADAGIPSGIRHDSYRSGYNAVHGVGMTAVRRMAGCLNRYRSGCPPYLSDIAWIFRMRASAFLSPSFTLAFMPEVSEIAPGLMEHAPRALYPARCRVLLDG